jgi:hypothetical protein
VTRSIGRTSLSDIETLVVAAARAAADKKATDILAIRK